MRILAFGEVLWDVYGDRHTMGGAPANVAFHAKQLGAEASLVSAVGGDALGRQILERLDTWGIDRSLTTISPRPTGTVTVQLDSAGQPTYRIAQDCAWDDISYDPHSAPLLRSLDAIVFGSLAQRSEKSRTALRRLLDDIGPHALRVFDVNLRPTGMNPAVITDSIKSCDLLKMNDTEVPYISECVGVANDEAQLSSTLFASGVQTMVVTRGAAGSSIFTPSSRSDLPAPLTEVQDTVGAGDAFTAVLVVELLRGRAIATAQLRASLIAAFVCSQRGSTPDIPARLLP